MADFWKRWTKPWTKEQCERRYVQGSKISVRELGEESGVPAKTLERWATQGSWKSKRGSYAGRLREKVEEKTLEKTSDRLSDELSQLSIEHFEAYKNFRKLAEIAGRLMLEECDRNNHPEMIEEVFKKLSPLAINFWSLVLDRSVKGERQAVGMEYEDINKAIAAVEKTGLKIIAPDDSIIAKLSALQESQSD